MLNATEKYAKTTPFGLSKNFFEKFSSTVIDPCAIFRTGRDLVPSRANNSIEDMTHDDTYVEQVFQQTIWSGFWIFFSLI